MTILLCALALILQDPFDVKVARDKSLTLEAYKKLGIPDPDRAWTPADFTKALGVFRKIERDDSCKLPRRDSPASGKLWTRFCSEENLEPLRDEKQPIKDRLAGAQELNDAIGKTMAIYGKPAKSGGFDNEAVDIMSLMLRLDVLIFELMAEQARSAPAGDTAREDAEKKMNQLRHGVGVQVGAALIMLGDLENVRTSALIRFARQFKTTLPKLAPNLLPEHQEALPVLIKDAIDLHENVELKGLLKEVLKALPEPKKK